MTHKNRLSPRALVHFPAQLSATVAKEISLNSMIVDISLTGARVHLSKEESIPNKVSITVQYLADIEPLVLEATWVWKHKLFVGLRFDSLKAKDAHILHALIAIHRAELKKPF